MRGDLGVRYAVPDRKNDLPSRDLTRSEAIEFALRPVLREETRAEDDHAESGPCQACVDGPVKTVAQFQREISVPDTKPSLDELIRQRRRDLFLVFAGVC